MSAETLSEVEKLKNRYSQRDDKRVIEGAEVQCNRCGGNDFVLTYYDHLATDRTCIDCNHTF